MGQKVLVKFDNWVHCYSSSWGFFHALWRLDGIVFPSVWESGDPCLEDVSKWGFFYGLDHFFEKTLFELKILIVKGCAVQHIESLGFLDFPDNLHNVFDTYNVATLLSVCRKL